MGVESSKTGARQFNQSLPRLLDLTVSGLGLVICAPVLTLCAAAVAAASGGHVLFRQRRVGRGGRAFTMLKFRTMQSNEEEVQVTASGDHRVTTVGRFLRKIKLDELPELWNVFRGDLSLVGPRPEVPRYVDLNDPMWQEVLRERPGITHPVTVRLVNEESLIASVGGDPEEFYVRELLPFKIRGYVAYQRQRSFLEDLRVLAATAAAIVGWRWYPSVTLDQVRAAGRYNEGTRD